MLAEKRTWIAEGFVTQPKDNDTILWIIFTPQGQSNITFCYIFGRGKSFLIHIAFYFYA